MKIKLVHNRKVIFGIVFLLLLAGTGAGLAAGEGWSLRRAMDTALRDNLAADLATLQVDLARAGAERTRQAVNDAVYRLITVGELLPSEWTLVYMGSLQAEQMESLALHRERAERDRLLLEVQRNYLEAYRAGDRLNLANLALSRAREQQRLAEVAFSAGTVARSDILAAQAHVAAAEARVIAAEHGVRSAHAALNRSLGRPLTATVELPAEAGLPERGTPDLQRGLSEAENSRLEIIMARETLRLKERERDFPMPVPGAVSRREAELAVDEARLQLEIRLAAVRLEVYQLYYRLAGLEKQLAALEQGVSYAAEAHRLAVLRYQAGVGTEQEVTGARDLLAEREQELLHARYEGYLGYLSWRLATGRGLE